MDKKQLNKYQNLIVKKLINIKPLKIIQFGSTVVNNYNENSDIDFLVVLNINKIPENYEEKMKLKLQVRKSIRDVSKKIPIDLLVYTIPEYEELKRINSSFYKDIDRTGKVVYEKAS